MEPLVLVLLKRCKSPLRLPPASLYEVAAQTQTPVGNELYVLLNLFQMLFIEFLPCNMLLCSLALFGKINQQLGFLC